MIVLVAGVDDEQITRLTHAAGELFPGAGPVAMQVDDGEVDTELAWGTRLPAVEAVEAVDPHDVQEEPATGPDSVDLPLPVVGDTSVAIAEAVRRVGAGVVVVAADHRTWLSRLFTGSATGDLVRQPPVPVLVVPVGDENA